jgi:predicted transglutaminase-like cysteine proteinase
MHSFLTHSLRCLAAATAVFAALALNPAHSQIIRMDASLHGLPDRGNEPFGLSAAPAPAGPMWIKWREFETGIMQSVEAVARCRTNPATCSPAETRLIALIEMARHASGRAKFGLVNREINLTIAYTNDAEQHGAADVWSSALASMASGRGDCEDFAIAKYLTLREAGVPASDLRLLVGRVRNLGAAHAVLAARLDGHWLILDNRRMAMLEDAYASDLQPLFALDHVGVKQFGRPAMVVAAARNDTDRENQVADIHPASSGDILSRGDALPLLM